MILPWERTDDLKCALAERELRMGCLRAFPERMERFDWI